jgi:hypothetical protein
MTSNQLNSKSSPDSITRAIAHGLLDLLNTETDGSAFWSRLQDTRQGFSESLFGELTTAEFVDYVRPQVTKKIFKKIELIAAEFMKSEGRANYPKTVILLMNLSRSHITRRSNIYQAALVIYEHYKAIATTDPQSEASKAALETGVQLYRHERDPEREEEIWPYLQFEYEHEGSLIERRMQFYGTKDPCVLFERTVNRWLQMASEYPQSALKKKDFDKFGALHPQLLDLPVPYDSSNSLRVVELLSQFKRKEKPDLNLEVSRLNQEELAKNLRVLQWDIFTRDLITEQRDHKLSYRSSIKEYDIPGTPPNKFLTDLIVKSRNDLREFVPLYAGILRARSQRNAEPTETPPKISQYRKGFERLLNAALKYSPYAYDDVIEFFAVSQAKGFITNAVLVEDGELSFFSLLWLLRHAVSEGDEPRQWFEDPENELSVGFLPTDEIKANSWWRKMNLPDFAELCGLVTPAGDGHYILTRRWRSMLQWLQSQQRHTNQSEVEARKPLPVKIFHYATADEKNFVQALADVLASPELATFLSDVKVYPDKISVQQFAREQIGPLITMIDPLLRTSLPTADSSISYEPNEPWPKRDPVIFKLCRAAFLPVEFLFRVYQPYELHLLILALSFSRTDLLEQKPAPVALGFATIAGALPPGVAEGAARNKARGGIDAKSTEITLKAHQWLVPYWTLFTALSAELSMGRLQESVMELWVTNILNSFSHEVGKHQAYIFNKLFLEMNHVFEIETVDKPTSDDLRLFLWPKPAGVIKAAEGSAKELSKWRVCPVPDTLKGLYQLYSVWAGAKNQLSDFGIDANCTFKDLLKKIKPMAREMAVARNRVEQAPLIRSLKDAYIIDETTRTRTFHNAEITEKLESDAKRLQFAGGEDYEYRMRKIFLIRALLAGLSNAVYHTPPNETVKLTARIINHWVEIEIVNPTLGQQKRGKDEFGIGSEAVMQTCARQLGGAARLFEQEGGNYYLSEIRFPLSITDTEELQWLKINKE